MDILEGNLRVNVFMFYLCNSVGIDCDKGGCGLNFYV